MEKFSIQDMGLDHFREYIFQSIESLEKKVTHYQFRIKKQRHRYNQAWKVSREEISNDIKELIDLIKNSKDIDIPLEVLILGKDLIGSSSWILKSYLKYLKSFINLSAQKDNTKNKNHQRILRILKDNIPHEESCIQPQDIFQCVFEELQHESEDCHYKTPLKCPKINTTIVLISGIFNELYRTAAFERGASHIQELFGIKYYVPRVHGRRGSTHNARLIKKQLQHYIDKHPKEKLWILAHSKGGIDCLHFLRRNSEFASKYVVGISTIATPIMGSPHTDHLLVRFIQMVIKLENTTLYQKIDRGRDYLLKNVPRYLSENFQQKWFERNAKNLPQNIFYSSLALESEWYQSHIWMLFAKFLFKNEKPNDGIVGIDRAHFPPSFKHMNMGVIKGHHLIGVRSSTFNQEALIQTYIMTLNYIGVLH